MIRGDGVSDLTWRWLMMLALTLAGWLLAHPPGGASFMAIQGPGLLWMAVLLSAIKGHWLIDHFMGMANAPRALRLSINGWLVLVLAGMAFL